MVKVLTYEDGLAAVYGGAILGAAVVAFWTKG